MDLHSVHQRLITVASEMGFVQSSEGDLGRFMRLLVASRPDGRFLELGTGVGFGGLGCWMGWTTTRRWSLWSWMTRSNPWRGMPWPGMSA